MVRRKPHTLTRAKATEIVDADEPIVARSVDHVPAGSFAGFIEPITPGLAMTAFGADCKRPHRLYADPGDASFLAVDDRIAWGDRLFHVVLPPQVYETGAPTDHAVVLLEEEHVGEG